MFVSGSNGESLLKAYHNVLKISFRVLSYKTDCKAGINLQEYSLDKWRVKHFSSRKVQKENYVQLKSQPRSQGLFPGLGAGRKARKKAPGNEVIKKQQLMKRLWADRY